MIDITGKVIEIIFYNEDNGYCVCELQHKNTSFIAVGIMPFLNLAENINITGYWKNHSDYGEQFCVELFEKVIPTQINEIEEYLSSGIIKGIGASTARKITKRFREDTLNIIQNYPDMLIEVKGITLEKANLIGEFFRSQKILQNITTVFKDCGINPRVSIKLYKNFKDGALEKIKDNPYILTLKEYNMDFKLCDKLANKLGIENNSSERLESGIKYIIENEVLRGHTFILRDNLIKSSTILLELEEDIINHCLVKLTLDEKIFIETEDEISKVYLIDYYISEQEVARKLFLLKKTEKNDFTQESIKNCIGNNSNIEISLGEKQINAVENALKYGVSIISGGPGTGKTTIIKVIINILLEKSYKIALTAPTGKAAKRMSQACDYKAQTIHRLLETTFCNVSNKTVFQKDEDDPLDFDVIIIDEVSMVDIIIMDRLLKATQFSTKLILVGDFDQLPSVGAGNVLFDIIKSEKIPTMYLDEIFRQSENSMISINAHQINNGKMPILNKKDSGFFMLFDDNMQSINHKIKNLITDRIPKSLGYKPIKDIQVLTPTRKGICGTINLNNELRNSLNTTVGKSKKYGSYTFKEGDRVMQIKNNYNIEWICDKTQNNGMGVYNGDTGIIQCIDKELDCISVRFDDDKIVEYGFESLDELEPAYAITVHKSQGSEFPVIIIPIFRGVDVLMTRNLLYTAVSRAKELVILVGSKNALKYMVGNNIKSVRRTGLEKKIKEFFEL